MKIFYRDICPKSGEKREIVRFVDLSDYFCKIRVPWEFFKMLNPFLHSEMDFEQQKKVIRVNLYRRILAKNQICRTTSQHLFEISCVLGNCFTNPFFMIFNENSTNSFI